MLIYLSVISLSLLISCLISFFGTGKSILSSKNIPIKKIRSNKIILLILVFFVGIFLLDKIDFPTPTKLIKQEISNDKLITLK